MAAATDEVRIDPADGKAYTFRELSGFYRDYSKAERRTYWEETCLPASAAALPAPVGGKAEGKSKGRGEPAAAKEEAAAKEATARGRARAAGAAGLVAAMEERERDWRIGPIVYQVFVDRFAPSADLAAKKHLYPSPCTLQKWSDLPKAGECNEETKYYMHELAFWGGDLSSLRSKVSYIKELGVDVLYLQPIVEAFSNHKYDTSDYKKVDPQYGTMGDFKHLVSDVHDAEMKLVLDGVFNHMGVKNANFQEALQGGKEAEKRDWFYFGEEYKPGFKTWGGSNTLVELHLENADIQKYLWKGKESVVAHWLNEGADGWRLDVASEIGLALLKSISTSAHRFKKGTLVVGEVWAYPPQWTAAMDGVLSLHLGVLIYGLVGGSLPGPSAAQSIERMIADSSIEQVLCSWIVVSNHDMPRLATKLPDLKLRQFAQALQFLWPGAPLLYYGDEVGLAGGDDPHNRAPMPWDKVKDENEMLKHTRKMVALRKKLRALRIGDYRALHSQKLMAFIRTTDRVIDVVVVMANPTSETVEEMVVIPVPAILGYTLFKDEMSGEEVRVLGSTVTLPVAPKSIRVLSMVDEVANPSGDQYKRVYGHPATFASIKP